MLENLQIGDDWNFNFSGTAYPYASPQFDSSSTVSVAPNVMMRAVQVQMGAESQTRVFHLGAGEEGDSVVGKVNNMGGGGDRDDIFNSTGDFEFDAELYLLWYNRELLISNNSLIKYWKIVRIVRAVFP